MGTQDAVIVIVTYNSARFIGQALRSLDGRTVHVVDNGSTDATAEIVSRFPHAQLLRSPINLGYGGAVNAGARLHPGRDLLVLNPDVIATEVAIQALEAHLRSGQVGLVAPRLTNPDGSLQMSARNVQTPIIALASRTRFAQTPVGEAAQEWHVQPSLVREATNVPWVTGAVMLLDRGAFDAIGGFDESYFLYQEDQDLCIRLHDAGWEVRYDPAVEMVHEHVRASTRNMRAAKRHVASTVRLYRRHPWLLSEFRARRWSNQSTISQDTGSTPRPAR